MSIETMTKLGTQTVGAGGSSSISFINIPQGYTDLKLIMSARSTAGSLTGGFADGTYIAFNNTITLGSWRQVYGTGTAASSNSNTGTAYIGPINGSTNTASTFTNTEIYISNYSGSTYKAYSVDSISENNATAGFQIFLAGLWANSSPVTSLYVYVGEGNFSQNSTFTLYGIKNARQTAGNSIKATGGAISFDGTYVVHTFTSSGTFTPTVALPDVDYLVVAGGGGGGANYGSGGGAGGLRSTVGATGGGGSLESALSLTANTSYTVTVGAGGAAQATDNVLGNPGSNSVFATITATGGGAGAGAVTNGGSGGSGGGAGGGSTTTTGGTGTTNQGYAGGNNSTGADDGGAGGGGAGGVGANSTGSSTGGAGGAGITTSISGTSTSYAGGGGGGNIGGASAGGGAGGASAGNGVAGTANTGGGGGGGGQYSGDGAAGGSGIVIIRYKA